jgi:hypothetical protein
MPPTKLGRVAATSPRAREALINLERICVRLPEVTMRPSHHTPTFFIREKKVLCHLWDNHHGDGRLALWCPAHPGVQPDLVEREPSRFFVPPYVGHRGWIGVRLDVDVDWDEVGGILDEAYRLVAPKTLVKQLDDRAP